MAWERAHDSGRPLARDRERFAQLHAARRPLYESVAGVVLADGAEKTPEFVDALRRGSGGPRMVWSAQGYPVWVGAGVLDAAADLLPDAGAASWSPTSMCCSSTASGSRAWPAPR